MLNEDHDKTHKYNKRFVSLFLSSCCVNLLLVELALAERNSKNAGVTSVFPRL